LEKVEKQYDLR